MDKQHVARKFALCIAPVVAVWLLLLDRKSLLRLTYKTMCLLPVTWSCSHGHSAKFSQRFWNQSPQWRFWVVLNDTISSSNLKNKTFQFSNTVLVSTFARSHNSRTKSSLNVYSSENSHGWASITSCQKTVVNLDDQLSVQVSSGWSFFTFRFDTNLTPATIW